MQNNAKVLRKVATVTIIANTLLLVLKLVISWVFANFAIFSDAVHSAIDLLTSVTIIVVSFFISAKPDKKHNYGHERIEALFTLILSFVIVVISIVLIREGVEGLIHPEATDKSDYLYLIITMVVSLLVKEGMFWYGLYNAKKIKSEMLRVTAWHNRSDSLSALAVLIGLICSSFMKSDIFESIAVIIVAILIIRVALESFVHATNQLIDRAASDEVCEKIRTITAAVAGVKDIDNLRTRLFGNVVNVDLEVSVDAKLTVAEASDIAVKIQSELAAAADLAIKSCTVQTRSAK